MPSTYAVAGVALVAAVGASAMAAVHLLGSGDSEATATVELDGGALALAQPTGVTVQEGTIEFYVGATRIPVRKMTGSVSVSRSRRQAMQGCNFGLILDEWGQSWAGDPFTALGPPLGIQEINAYGVLYRRSDAKTYRFPLLLRGLIDNMERESSPTGGHFDTYECHDAAARYARVPVTIIFPPGHGLPRLRMVRKIFALAGETHFALDDGGKPGWAERQFIDAPPLDASQEILDLENRVVRWDRFGNVVAPKMWDPDKLSVATFTEADILAISSARLRFPGDVITEVTATGTEQVHSAGDPVCGEVSEPPLEVETRATFSPFVATYRQNIGGTLTSLGYTAEPREQRETLTITRRIKRCGTLVREETATFQHYNPVAARYQQSGVSRVALECQLGADGTVGGSEDAFLYVWAPWSMVGFVRTNHYYHAESYGGPLNPDPDRSELFGVLAYITGDTPSGVYLGKITDSFSFYNRRTATKQRVSPTDVFDTLDPINGVRFTGAGDTVIGLFEVFQRTSRVIEVVRSEHGYQKSATAYAYGYAVDPRGSEYQFSDGALSDAQHEIELMLQREGTTYAFGSAENTHDETTVAWTLGQSPKTATSTALAGGPPAAEYLPGYSPDYDPSAFMSAEDQEFAETARDDETRPIKVTVSADGLLTTHLPRAHKAAFPYAENTEDLSEAATSIIVESLVVPFSITLPFNPLLSEDDVITVTHRPAGVVAQRCVIETIRWEGNPSDRGAPWLTQLGLSIYPAVGT